MNIACIGEAMIELSLASDDSSNANIGFAGDTLNASIYMQRTLGKAGRVSYITAVGRDRFSDRMLDMMRREQLDVDLVARSQDRQPGLYAISTDEHGERSFSYWRNQSAARLLFHDNVGPALDDLNRFDGIYFSGITLAVISEDVRAQLLDWLQDYRGSADRWVAFDSNYRPRLWRDQETARTWTQRAYECCDIALSSVDDEQALFGDPDEAAVRDRLHAAGVKKGAIKRGDKGPLCLTDPNHVGRYQAAKQVVDTTACGDSFNGAYLASLALGRTQSEALQSGHDCASRVLAHHGAIMPL